MRTWLQKTFLKPEFWTNERTEPQMPEVVPSVAIAIPAYNEEATIANTIQSCLGQNYPNLRIIVIDDGSSDRTGEIARSMGVEVLRPEQNTGSKCRALNYALQFIDSDFFVSVDADTTLFPDAVSKLIPHFNNPEVGIACGFVTSTNMNSVWEKGRAIEYLYAQNVLKTAQNKMNAVLISAGCFTIIRTDLLKQLGGFTERTMAEDMDLTWQVIEHGYQVEFVENALCSVIDPPNKDIFWKQVSRWLHGFVQNIRVRKFDLFSKNPKLGIVAYFYLIWMLFGSIFLPFALFTIVESWPLAFIWFIGIMITFVWIPAYHQGRKFGIPKWSLIKAMPSVFVVYYMTILIFIETLYKEFVRNETVTVWHKGH